VYEYYAGGCDLNSSIEGETLNTYITENNGIINYKVTDENGMTICEKEYNTSELNISGDIEFTYSKLGVQIDDDNAAENNETAGDEVNATVLDFQTK
jgi:hypothetical protein